MSDIAALGGPEFILGFQLAGIKQTVEVSQNPDADFRKLMGDKNIGIIMTDENTVKKLIDRDRLRVESSVNPVVVVLSTEDYSEGLRKMIKKSIGVDLW